MATTKGTQAWRTTLYLLLVSNCLSMLGLNFALPFMSLYIRDLGVTDPGQAAFWAGVALAAGGVSLFIFGPIWGAVGDWIGRKAMVVRASVGGGFSVAALGLAPSMPWVVFMRSFEGVFSGNTGAGQAMVASIAPKERLSQSMSLLQMATFTGVALGPLVGGVVVDHLGFRVAFFVTGSLMMLGGVFLWRFAKEEKTPTPAGAIPSPLKLMSNLVDVMRSREALILLGTYLLLQIAAGMVNPVLPLFLQSIAGEGASVASLLGTALFMTGVIGAFTSILVSRFSQRIRLKALIIFACLGYSAVFLAQLLATTVLQFTVLTALSGVFRASMTIASLSLIGLAVPKARVGSAFGIVQSLGSASLATAPFVGGTLASLLGLRSVFALAGGSFLLLMLLVIAGIREPQVKTGPAPARA